ncbi:uncharacterized protein LOC120665707 isoform X2 [Panicum virgatum]|uniref:non-specific serine/threonine protein kinase n=1 Tax=Panicum virgatum TaxID=38727 RepID=A0A8T0VXD6_PANVG|nr:uncharacterized protein LOC120665707 isoform X2 [Panicum virgatum]KAG2640802.1 hypothetical protein PVAP13_2KG120100 [Panicum virgatum]
MWRRCRRLAMKMSCFTPPGEPSSVRHGFSTQCTPVHYGTRSRSSSLGATSSAAAARAISTAKGPHVQDSEEDEDEEEEEEEQEDSYGKQFEIGPSLLQDAPPAMELEEVSFQFLEEITDGFSEERRLGEGAFGVVYKGVTKNGGVVAVKKLKYPDVDPEYMQFKNEFDHLKKLRHPNIVQILGYCYETQKKPFIMDDRTRVTTEEIYAALCLEYLDNGSLQKHLSDKFCELDWHTRFKIIKGTCEGLKYIHDKLEEPIYHLDIKPANILLDKDMVPKIADFGWSRIIGKEQICKAKDRYGTPGYQPPEHIETGEISRKFDIFSLGIVIIMIVSGPEGYAIYLDGMSTDEFNKDEFINQVRKDWRNRLQATYRDDFSIEAYCHQVEACTQIAVNCVEKDKQKRPDILKITEMLNEIEIDVGQNSSAYPEQGKLFTMHDLVHDLAISLFDNQILDQSKQGNNSGSSCQYALLTDCSKALEVCLTPRARLIRLSFLDNSRSKLSDAAFTASSMRVADISESSVQTLPDYSTGKWKQLRYLNAPGIPDRMVPESITTLTKLIYLNLQGSAIIALPESIGEMECLTHLDLSACERLQQLPDSFRNLEKLVHLNFSNCYHVKGVPDVLKGLTNLQYLNLSQCSLGAFNCRLRGLQDVIGNLTRLRYLNVSNSLHDIPVDGINSILRSICTFSNLQHLVLSANFNIFCIPETVGKLTKLHTLDLRFCSNLRRLPASISEIDSLKFLDVTDCDMLDKSKLPRFSKCSVFLPHFFVHAGDGKPSSNLVELKDENPPKLEISGLENVKSVEEAQMIKLVEKTTTRELQLEWTKDAKRSVEDIDVLREFVPASTLEVFTLHGYNSVSFPTWVIRIAINLPLIRTIELNDLPWCRTLPPLGQLQNLLSLFIIQMGSIRKIDEDLCGGARAFPKLHWLGINRMENLEEWNTTYSHSEDGSGVLVFPKNMEMYIVDCPKLKLKPRPPAGFSDWVIKGSDNVLSSWGEEEHCQVTELFVRNSKVPLHQWRVLYHLPALSILRILECRDLTCSSLDILRGHPTLKILTVEDSESIAGLLDGLETLTSLEKLEIISCTGAKALPEGITQLTNLRCLKIKRCPELVQWCKSEENSMKLAHIKKIKLVNDEECDEELESDEEHEDTCKFTETTILLQASICSS